MHVNCPVGTAEGWAVSCSITGPGAAMTMRPTLRRFGGRHGSADVGAEVEALLAGRYVGWLRRRGERVPAWAWLNGLAHGASSEVSALAVQRHLIGRDPAWRRARRLLAGEIVAVAGAGLVTFSDRCWCRWSCASRRWGTTRRSIRRVWRPGC